MAVTSRAQVSHQEHIRSLTATFFESLRGIPQQGAEVRDFKGLKVWQKAHQLVLDIYRQAQTFPPDERFGLRAHLVKSATSIPSNIAEGCGRDTDTELARFLSIAAGSAAETEYQLILAHDLGYLTEQQHRDLDAKVNEVKRMLNSFIQRLG
jgi:four helix bundle protein